MSLQTIKNLDLKEKVVILRIDINTEIIRGQVQDNPRFKAHSETINFLKKKKAKVIILAHQGNPGEHDFTSLEQHAKILHKYTKIKFVKNIIGKKAINSIQDLKNGEALLLDNVRFLKDEFNPGDNKFVKILSEMADMFVMDAFSVCHRNQSSIVSFPRLLPSYIGLVMENELNNIERVKKNTKNALFILGGVKVKDLVPILKNNVLSTGTLSLLCLIAKGYSLGKEKEILKNDLKFINKLKINIKNIVTPIDLAVSINGKRKNINIDDLPSKYPIYDIGDKTIKLYDNEIKKAKVIFFKGAVGKISDKNFQKGTKEILKAISRSRSFSVISGGSSASSIDKFKISKNSFSYISLSGGALVHYLAGEKLPGLEALTKGK